MKRLIVLATLATLLASASGCSLFNHQCAQSCDPAPSEPCGRIKMPKISLPWNRAKDFDQGCNSCKAGSSDTGFSETGFSEPQVTSEPSYSSGQVIDGQVIDGSVINGQVIDGQVINGQVIDGMVSGESSRHTLYHPEVVGPAHTSTVSTTASYAGELIPRPASPTVDLGK